MSFTTLQTQNARRTCSRSLTVHNGSSIPRYKQVNLQNHFEMEKNLDESGIEPETFPMLRERATNYATRPLSRSGP